MAMAATGGGGGGGARPAKWWREDGGGVALRRRVDTKRRWQPGARVTELVELLGMSRVLRRRRPRGTGIRTGAWGLAATRGSI
jgi:hypothetical protein